MPVIHPNEVSLNSVRYPLKGQVQPILSSKFAEKRVTGDYTKDSDPYTSKWVISDQRGGMLVEEMVEAQESARCWWSTANLSFRGNITLPPLATLATLPAITSVGQEASLANTDMEAEGSWTGGERNVGQKHGGSYAWILADADAYQDATTWTNNWRGKMFTFTCWVYTTAGNTGRISINDGVDTTYSPYHTGAAGWEFLTVTKTLGVSGSTTRLRCQLHADTVSTTYFDDCAINTSLAGNVTTYANFNGVLYIGYGTILCELDSAGTGFDAVFIMPAAITDIVAQLNTYMYILLGDSSAHYYYMDTSQVFLEADEADCTYGIVWDDKLFKTDSAGALAYCATPNAAAPTFTANGSLPIDDNSLQRLFLYYDAAGDDIIYAGTNEGLWAHDYTNAKWLQTQLKTPDHPTSGKGCTVWREAAYITAGLTVHKYVAAETATISSIGLDQADGLPQLRNGEIVKLIEGYNEFFALVDSTYEGATSRSSVMAYDGRGWQCWWEATADNKNMYGGIVSSDTAHRLWFSTTDGVYFIALPRTTINPKKNSAYTYGLAAVHVTPWFDADWQVGNKLAIEFVVSTRDCSADESIIVRYRIDHATTALAATWTLLGTITSDGETTYSLTSGAGFTFRSIQFRFEFARAAGTNTNSPILEYARLSYEKVIPKRWGWQFTVDCTQSYDNKSPDQLLDAVVTAAELETLVPFIYKSTTYYVRVQNVRGERLTGDGKKGTYEIFVVEMA